MSVVVIINTYRLPFGRFLKRHLERSQPVELIDPNHRCLS